MNAKEILSDQIIIKKGRFNSFGFEPCANAFFDFYLSSKYVSPAILKLEDVSFFLFLRKNLNDRDPTWKMPTIRQMMRRLSTSQVKIYGMMERLEKAHLLRKETGFRNSYVLSDPIPTLNEFLIVASMDSFSASLLEQWKSCIENQYEIDEPVLKDDTEVVLKNDTNKQTSKKKQKGDQSDIWIAFLQDMKMQLPKNTYDIFLSGTTLQAIEDSTAVIGITAIYTKDWVENRMANKIKYALKVDGVRCVVMTE